jgi:large subunit ribosomal protein L25
MGRKQDREKERKKEAMDFAKVDAEIRQQNGKGNARRTRAQGKVPAVLYGRKEQPVPLNVDPLALVRSMDKERRRNTVFSLAVSGDGAGGPVTAMIRDVQFDPVSRKIIHVDFLRVSLDEEVRVAVPLVLKGTPVGVVNGGNLHHAVHELPIAAKPAAIPLKIEYDVSGLNIGQAVHVSDLKLEAGVRALLDAKTSLASVVAPRAEKTEEAAAVPAEGAAAVPAEGAAPAAGAAAGKKEGEKAPAAAPAKEAEKKGK